MQKINTFMMTIILAITLGACLCHVYEWARHVHYDISVPEPKKKHHHGSN